MRHLTPHRRIVFLRTDDIWQIDTVWDTDVTPDSVGAMGGFYVKVQDTPRASYYVRRGEPNAIRTE